MLTRLSLRLRVLLIFLGLSAGVAAMFALGLMLAGRRLAEANLGYLGQKVPGASAALTAAGVVGVFGAAVLIVGVWYLFDRNVAKPIEALAGGLRTGAAPDLEDSRYLADLGPAARDAAEARAQQAERLAAAIQEHASDLAREKTTLEAILSDFGAGALMTDAAGRVLFYNASAARLLPGLGLDRPLDRFVRSGAVDAARARLAAGAEATDLTCITTRGDSLTGRMRALDGAMLLILRDRPADRPLSRSALESLRRHSATLVPMLESLDGPIPPALASALRAEGQGLARAMRDLSQAMAEAAPVARASLRELATGLDLADDTPAVDFLADAGAMNALLVMLNDRLRAEGHDPRLTVEPGETGADEAYLVLHWQGKALPMDRLEAWLETPPDPDLPERTGAEMLSAQGTGIWAEALNGDGRLILPLPVARAGGGGGGLTYDFALAGRGAASTRLADLTCVVFDTETTGLSPSDRIVQIAGVRIARGRLTGERFDTLVNPGRAIPPASTAVHHVTDEMVADAPDMTAALNAFHHFAEGAVLVAHNAPFDMGFLRSAAPETGAHFDNRVLDTVLLSAMVYGQSAVHTLDALTDRLGIVIPPEDRHTAMGDTVATAQAFLRLIEALSAKGLDRFEDVLEEARKHRRLIEDANIIAHPAMERDKA
ncbi:MAG: 3'-5' exonuclease [Paracoccus sp. (in: a-proteobacteria)]|uniref:3'-5' exonuclease n=1 Tax=Paracoccus sp. TaxID=267 RepID=UPI0026E0C384|nr:3'-5' exonuclease [Paracoccus sp. (in: a-proteobacteria)]MDO5612168.1 3'-5' exonuclease [Paracoccus sp. (in: a-proteobacteria)]